MTVNSDQTRALRAVLQANKLAVLATCSHSAAAPESSLVAFAESENLSLYVQCKWYARKASNLTKNRTVSLVVGLNQEPAVTLQIEGQMTPVLDEQQIARIRVLFTKKRSPSLPFYTENLDSRFFRLDPDWLRYSTYDSGDPVVWEVGDSP